MPLSRSTAKQHISIYLYQYHIPYAYIKEYKLFSRLGVGYITLCRSDNLSGLHAASLLAQSIKLHDKKREVALVTDNIEGIASHIQQYFDYIVELPYGAVMDEDFDVNIWQVYYCTPFDKNLFLCKQCLLLLGLFHLLSNLRSSLEDK